MDVYICDCGRLTRDDLSCGYCTEAEREAHLSERRKGHLNRYERLQRMADNGYDTWQEYDNER